MAETRRDNLIYALQGTHLLLAEHALPDAGEGETHLCRVLPFFCFYNTALHLRKGFMVRECRFRAVFSLCLFVVCPVARTSDANPLGAAGGPAVATVPRMTGLVTTSQQS